MGGIQKRTLPGVKHKTVVSETKYKASVIWAEKKSCCLAKFKKQPWSGKKRFLKIRAITPVIQSSTSDEAIVGGNMCVILNLEIS